MGEDRATASVKTEQRRRGRQSRGGVGVDRDGREQRWSRAEMVASRDGGAAGEDWKMKKATKVMA